MSVCIRLNPLVIANALPSRLKSSLAGVCLVFGLLVSGWFVWFRFVSTEQFRNAMERRDFGRAERLWNFGVFAPDGDPYIEFMRVIERLEAVKEVQVQNYYVRRTPAGDISDRYIGTLNIHESGKGSTKEFGVAMEWKGQKWSLKIDHELLPSYVKQSLEGQR
jgi:hypothetical protein